MMMLLLFYFRKQIAFHREPSVNTLNHIAYPLHHPQQSRMILTSPRIYLSIYPSLHLPSISPPYLPLSVLPSTYLDSLFTFHPL